MAPVTSPADRDRERVGPHPSYIEIAKPYILQSRIHKCLTDINMSDAKEDIVRLQGVAWIDQVRRALQLPIRTFNTAVTYYHKFRLLHSDNEYNWADASAAALFTACKIEDTLKKSREILCAHWNLKVGPGESLSSDDPRFDNHSKLIIGLERLMLESAGFDFRNRYPQKLMVKLARALRMDKNNASKTAWNLSIDLYRTFAPLKQSAPTMAIACIELAARLHDMDTPRIFDTGIMRYSKWATSRAEVMETLLDLLDLYTHHRGLTSIGPLYTLETFINIRIGLNQEASAANIPRYAQYASEAPADGQFSTNGFKPRNGIDPTSPLTPATPGTISPGNIQAPTSAIGIRGQNGTVRFMLDAARARDERNEVDRFHKIEEEEYEVEVPIDNRPEDRDKRSRDYQDHQDFQWQSDTGLDHIEDPAPMAPIDRGTRGSYWERFRKRSEAPEKLALENPSTLYGDYSDNINYFGELTAGIENTPQRATGHQHGLEEHVDSAVPIELRNNQTPRKKGHRKGREKQKAKRQARLSNAESQLQQSDYDRGLVRSSPYAPEGPGLFGMPTYWATETGHWGSNPTLQRQLANRFDDSNFDNGRRGGPAHVRGRGSSGRSRRGSLIAGRGDFVRNPSYDLGPRKPSHSSYGGPYAEQSHRARPIDGRSDFMQDAIYDHGPRRPSHSPYSGPHAEQSRHASLIHEQGGFVRDPDYGLGPRRPSYSSFSGPDAGQSHRASLIHEQGGFVLDPDYDLGPRRSSHSSYSGPDAGQGRRASVFVQDASYDQDPRRPSHSSYGGLGAGYGPQYGPYSPLSRFSEGQRPDSPFGELGIDEVFGHRPGSVTDRRDGFGREPSLDYDSRRPSTSFYDGHVAEHQAHQDAYHTPHRNGERKAMPYASRLSNFRKQQQRTYTNKEKIKQPESYRRLEQAVQHHGAAPDRITKRAASREPVQDTSEFLHPDRAWLRSPDENRMEENGGKPSSHSESFPIEMMDANTHTRQSHGRPTPSRTPEGQTRMVSRSPSQDYGTCPVQAPQSREAGKGLSEEDGHQWARGRADDRSRRGGRRGGKGRYSTRNYQGGGIGRRGRS